MSTVFHPHTFIEKTSMPNSRQREAASMLVMECSAHDKVPFSFPDDSGEEDMFYFLWEMLPDGSQRLLSVLSLLLWDQDMAECFAFTHPSCRRRGCFSMLLSNAMETYESFDILFCISGDSADTLEVMKAIGAEHWHTDLRMEAECASQRPPCPNGENGYLLLPTPSCGPFAGTVQEGGHHPGLDNVLKLKWSFYGLNHGEWTLFGSCQTTKVSESCFCLHHVEILPKFRNRGLGTKMLRLLMDRLFAFDGFRTDSGLRLILHVSEDNAAAVALYKKTGFRITEILSCYIYP